MAFRYLQVNSLHCVIDDETSRVVDSYTDELAAYKAVRALNGEDEADAAPGKGEMPAGTSALSSADLAKAGNKARHSLDKKD